ncbi:hypothetical protein F5879DRAFT_973524 [Lentinula edodes]|uniref:DUF6699 domain-containing protein n=2 Tax=Lentinula TaxID=5352 RepID=A0A1Q3EHL2_LENED|nr:uncharacterized protein C8R40DRAFT_459405 [Lentinula edodes]KAJ3860058.1 hypothetical protein EV359DRAFT_49881 [Lentinula novae-zelandiae]KAJ3926477.1 MAG: hypothetical protein NXY57DRAFT_722791 [Lentinula lateritia]KAH7880025.1 hypothetical protein C8R40DRAFT_459405 [Lentinula edodes]KAJ3877034.1 hypothetical protein F5051DRAFT_17264 [Lentinula edodes]KAJ3900254.1 hypothetical protein F5879DRAFT_973524 [Lentinula edodes]
MDSINKWAAGSAYGPVLSQTDLYLLQSDLLLNPILAGSNSDFHLLFNIATGQTGGFNPDARDRDLAFTAKDEPATLPRVSQLIIITEISPWCTIVKNERGVNLGDVCSQIWKDYSDHHVTDAEFASLPPRLQDQVKRTATMRGTGGNWSAYYTPAAPPARFKRFDWLRERTFFDRLQRKDTYAAQRLGFKAPNIFVMELTA